MKNFSLAVLTWGVVLALASTGFAKPSWGEGCAGCHATSREALATPPLFTAQPGTSVDLIFEVTNGANKYALNLPDLPETGLAVAPDPTWGDYGTYYATPVETWGGGGSEQVVFALDVDPGAAQGPYPLTAVLAGKGSQWSDTETFVLDVIPEPATLALIGVGALLSFRRRRKM